jgi:hypothetical protein
MSERYLPPGIKHAAQAYELITDHCMYFLKGSELKIALYIVRRTIGFGKERDRIALDQFCHGIKTRNGRQLDRGTGLSRRAAQQALDGLKGHGLLSEIVETGKANEYGLNWQAILQHSQKSTIAESSPPTSAKNTPVPAQEMRPQPSVQISVVQPSVKKELDCATENRKRRDSSSRSSSSDCSPSVQKPPSKCTRYPKLKSMLARYMDIHGGTVHPSDRTVVEVMDAAGGATEEEVGKCLEYLYNERGLRPGTENGPRRFAWFVTVVADYFDKRRRRAEVARAGGREFWSGDGIFRER